MVGARASKLPLNWRRKLKGEDAICICGTENGPQTLSLKCENYSDIVSNYRPIHAAALYNSLQQRNCKCIIFFWKIMRMK